MRESLPPLLKVRSATTRDGNGRSAKKYLPTNESFRGIRIHKARR
jgi:hypothetical protein